LLKELKHVLSNTEFEQKRELFESSPNFKRATLSEKEYEQVRKIEKETKFEVIFFDIIHMLLAKKTKSILVTRDKKLRDVAAKYSVRVNLPEREL
jgi:predicted nucleic acid-binding protein